MYIIYIQYTYILYIYYIYNIYIYIIYMYIYIYCFMLHVAKTLVTYCSEKVLSGMLYVSIIKAAM